MIMDNLSINPEIGLILLAAGESRRLQGLSKQLLKFKEKTLIRLAAEQALGSLAKIVCVVLGARSETVKEEIKDLQLESVINEDWLSGMSSSIKSGLNHLLKIAPNLSAVVLQLCDQPLITSEIINRLAQTYYDSGKGIIASEYDGTFGVPAVFDKSYFDELLNLNEQTGAKSIIKRHKEDVVLIETPEAAFDIDTREDYERLLCSKMSL